MHMQARTAPGAARLLFVQAPEDIEYLVKESEVLTGRSGRVFVIASADWLIYRVHWQPHGPALHANDLVVERLGPQGQVLNRQQLQRWQLPEHSLVHAQLAGQLFTHPVCRQG